MHHNLIYTVISVTRRFDVQRKYFIVKSCNYISVDGSRLFSMHQVSHCLILLYTIYSKMYYNAISLPNTYLPMCNMVHSDSQYAFVYVKFQCTLVIYTSYNIIL